MVEFPPNEKRTIRPIKVIAMDRETLYRLAVDISASVLSHHRCYDDRVSFKFMYDGLQWIPLSRVWEQARSADLNMILRRIIWFHELTIWIIWGVARTEIVCAA